MARVDRGEAIEPTWRALSRKHGVRIRPAPLVELLDLLDRVVCRGEGWGPGDPMRGCYRSVPLLPARLVRQTRRRRDRTDRGRVWSDRTWRRAIERGEELGLLLVERSPGLPPRVAPAWWRHPADDPDPLLPERVWQTAAELLGVRVVSGWCPGSVRVPVRSDSAASACSPKVLAEGVPGHFEGTDNRGQRDRELPSKAPSAVRGGRETPPPACLASEISEGERSEIRELLQETIVLPGWQGLSGLIRGRLRSGFPAHEVIQVIRETLHRWHKGQIDYPLRYVRHVLDLRCHTEADEAPPWVQNTGPNTGPTRPEEPASRPESRPPTPAASNGGSSGAAADLPPDDLPAHQAQSRDLYAHVVRPHTEADEAPPWVQNTGPNTGPTRPEEPASRPESRDLYALPRAQGRAVAASGGRPERRDDLLRARNDPEELLRLAARWETENRCPPERAPETAPEGGSEALCEALCEA